MIDLSPEIRAKLKSRFVDHALQSMAAIDRAAATLDRKALGMAAHALRGAALYMEEVSIVDASGAIEAWSRQPQADASIRPLVVKLSEAVDTVVLEPFTS